MVTPHQFLKSRAGHYADHIESDAYDLWKRCGQHFEEYASEFVGTTFLVFAVVTVVSVVFAHSSPFGHYAMPPPIRLLIAGLLIGGSGWLVALSPPGRLSGAHINPAISVGFYLLNKMYLRDMLWYVAAQMLGGVVGAAVGIEACGKLAREVGEAALSPAATLTPSSTFALEFATTAILATVIFYCVAHDRLAKHTPAFVTLTAGVLVCLDGSLSGAGMNPARWIGPALYADVWRDGVVYFTAPIAGAALVAAIRRVAGHPSPRFGKLMHDPLYRSLFKHDKVTRAQEISQ